MNNFKKGFEKTSGVAREFLKSVRKATPMSNLVKNMGPSEASRKIKLMQHMKRMKASGISDDQIRASVRKVNARKASKKVQDNVYDAGQMKKEFVAKGIADRRAKMLSTSSTPIKPKKLRPSF